MPECSLIYSLSLSLSLSLPLPPPLSLSPSLPLLSHTESVFQVAQYITSTPTLYTDCNNYIDACVIANNPCDYALTRLQQYYFMRREQQPVSLVVSVGTGIYSHAKMGDLPRIMSPGKQRTRSREAWHRLENFIILMKNSVSLEKVTYLFF